MLNTKNSIANLSLFFPDVAAYIASHLGAQHLPLSTIVPISVVYTIIFILGVLGNVSTILVILKNKYMHTPTNVYLANLAISDLLTHLVGKKDILPNVVFIISLEAIFWIVIELFENQLQGKNNLRL